MPLFRRSLPTSSRRTPIGSIIDPTNLYYYLLLLLIRLSHIAHFENVDCLSFRITSFCHVFFVDLLVFFFFQCVSAGFDRVSVRVNAVSHGNRAISLIFSDEFVYSQRYFLFNCVYWIKNVVARAQSRPDTVSPRVSLPVFPR